MKESLFIAQPIEGGYTWTLASRTGDILREVVDAYGPRDMSYTLLGVEFAADGPQIWYPGGGRRVAIQLSRSAMDSLELAIYQLAHECVHLLAPSGGRVAPVLEEGLATAFAQDYVTRTVGPVGVTSVRYASAAYDVRELLAIDGDSIRKLRQIEPAFYKMGPDAFGKAGLTGVPSALRDRLLMPFYAYMTDQV
ncbi:hypothetical protein K788_00001970 [Paraburkholderia caribensis MBA4]|uniref:Uncharacterized protein n=1 Tax=Paraburkholderia caribensis MBA4 TaxID=1323664 RepID=A0A0P0RIJ0_9BURK|nr:hypothetical protein [Paraburkholderia caribensis]ALL68582.1 hypothetical protein K788_00001970 [Paraburkholderia caribensis MBA4]